MGVERRDLHAGQALQAVGDVTEERYESVNRGLGAFGQSLFSRFVVYGGALLAAVGLIAGKLSAKDNAEPKKQEVVNPYIISPADSAKLKDALAAPKPEKAPDSLERDR